MLLGILEREFWEDSDYEVWGQRPVLFATAIHKLRLAGLDHSFH